MLLVEVVSALVLEGAVMVAAVVLNPPNGVVLVDIASGRWNYDKILSERLTGGFCSQWRGGVYPLDRGRDELLKPEDTHVCLKRLSSHLSGTLYVCGGIGEESLPLPTY